VGEKIFFHKILCDDKKTEPFSQEFFKGKALFQDGSYDIMSMIDEKEVP
jgi:hypothetical protein